MRISDETHFKAEDEEAWSRDSPSGTVVPATGARARSLPGIDWNAIDDEPAHFAFLILTPSEDAGARLDVDITVFHGEDIDLRTRKLPAIPFYLDLELQGAE